MPTYEYLCAACDHRFEEFQSITAKPIRKCPSCKKSKVDRLLGTGAGMIFKGSGFYITDYRSEGYKSAAKADSGAGGTGGTDGAGSAPAANGSKAESASSGSSAGGSGGSSAGSSAGGSGGSSGSTPAASSPSKPEKKK